ncbi:Hypothetical protein UVM_LOCUS305 [uncultured virus]|nr:Hypothetical protein UVM_LOCUS305 [uncultured virus]
MSIDFGNNGKRRKRLENRAKPYVVSGLNLGQVAKRHTASEDKAINGACMKVIDAAKLNALAKFKKPHDAAADSWIVDVGTERAFDASFWIVRGRGDGNDVLTVLRLVKHTRLENGDHVAALEPAFDGDQRLSKEKLTGAVAFYVPGSLPADLSDELDAALSHFPKTLAGVPLAMPAFQKLSRSLALLS